MWIVILIVILAGATGGVLNALLTDNGFLKWRREIMGGVSIWRPGVLGNIITGAAAAFISWALYGPLASADLLASQPAPTMTLSTLGGAILIGVSGARWLTSAADERIYKVGMMDIAKKIGANIQEEEFMRASPMKVVEMSSRQT